MLTLTLAGAILGNSSHSSLLWERTETQNSDGLDKSQKNSLIPHAKTESQPVRGAGTCEETLLFQESLEATDFPPGISPHCLQGPAAGSEFCGPLSFFPGPV